MANRLKHPSRQWDEASVFAALAEASDTGSTVVARRLLDFATGLGADLDWNNGPRPHVRIRFTLDGSSPRVMSIYTYPTLGGYKDGFVAVNINSFHNKIAPKLLSAFITMLRKSPRLAEEMSDVEAADYEREPSLRLDYLEAHPEEVTVIEDALRMLIERG